MERKIYLHMKPLTEAQDIFFNCLDYGRMLEEERIPTTEALGRVLAGPVFARFSSPNFHAAAMDGIALGGRHLRDQHRAAEAISDREGGLLDQYRPSPAPAGTNAVIMVENLNQLEGDRLELQAAAYPWQNVRKLGEDMVATELLLPQGHRINAYDLGALVAGGFLKIWAVKKAQSDPDPHRFRTWLNGTDLQERPFPPGKVPGIQYADT